jgi:DNA-binding MarR family transcriptional regulator
MRKKETNLIKVSPLTSHIGFWMRFVSNHVSYAFADTLKSSGVTVAEWVILREMYNVHETTSVSRIAELTNLTRGAVSKLMSRLIETKLMTRSESTEDRRFQDVALTATGKALVPRLALLADDNDEMFFSALSQQERQVLMDLLKKLVSSNKLTKPPIN